MALQVWLPLNGDLKNRGLSNSTVTNNGATIDNNGKIGKCYNFTRTNGSVISLSPIIPEEVSELSICSWMKLNENYERNNGLHLITVYGGDGNIMRICLSKDGYFLRHLIDYSYSGAEGYGLDTDIIVNKWYHIAVTIKEQTVKTYINGELVKTYNLGRSISNINLNQPINIGSLSIDEERGNGCINDFRIYDNCLSTAEVKEISKGLVLHYPLNDVNINNTIYDCSGYGNNGTVVGSLSVSADSPRYSHSTLINQQTTITHPRCLSNDNQEWTCCAWIKMSNALQWSTKLNNFNYANALCAGNDRPILYLVDGNNPNYAYGESPIPLNEWAHIAFVFKNSNDYKKVYLNGIDITIDDMHSNPDSPKGIPDVVRLFDGYEGLVSDYREYSTALSADDVLELYNTGAKIAKNGTLMCYELKED